jgi:hypothetical protein
MLTRITSLTELTRLISLTELNGLTKLTAELILPEPPEQRCWGR